MKPVGIRGASAAAFSLVEVALALGVAGFCLAAVVALLPIGVNSSQTAFSQAAATSIVTHVLADLRATPTGATPGTASTSAEYLVPIPAAGGGSTTRTLYFGDSSQQFSSTPQASTSRYRLTVTFLPQAGDRTATSVTLLVTWPAAVDPAASPTALGGRVQMFGALNRN